VWERRKYSLGKIMSVASNNMSVTISFSMSCDAAALSGGGKEALEAVLSNSVTGWGGLDFKMGRPRVGWPDDDTLQRVLPLLLVRLGPEDVWRCVLALKIWRRELEAQGVCMKTFQLCVQLSSSLAQGCKLKHLGHKAMRRLEASIGAEQPWAVVHADIHALLQRPWIESASINEPFRGSLHHWLQAASQEPDTSFLSRGAASTSRVLGLQLVQWMNKPQGRYPGCGTLVEIGEDLELKCVAFSPDGQRIASGLSSTVKIWDAKTGAQVSSLLASCECVGVAGLWGCDVSSFAEVR